MEKKIYDYTQTLMAYHSEVLEKCAPSFDEVCELYKHPGNCEVSRHFRLYDHMLETVNEKLTIDLILSYHSVMVESGFRDKDSVMDKVRGAAPAAEVQKRLNALLNSYLGMKFPQIVDFLARYEQIHPFEEQCSAVGIMLAHKECLRLGTTPIVVYTGKKTSAYLTNLVRYDEDPEAFRSALRKMRLRYKREIDCL